MRRSRGRGWGEGWEHRHSRGPRRMSRRPHGRPHWWPADEQWPPRGPECGHARRRVFFRVALAVTFLVLVAVVIPLALLWLALRMADVKSPGRVVVGGGLIFLLIALVALAAGGARRIALPLGNLVEAAGRVEAGDYSVRLDERHLGPSELRALTRAFNDMTARLAADEAQRRTLLADVGHELRTPLAVLQGQIEAMVDGIHPADEAHLAAALEEIRVLGQLVEDLRTLTLAEAGTLTLHREPTDLAVLAQDTVSGFEGLARSAGVTLRVEMADDLSLLELDPIRIRQVLGNLISNALRYAPKGSAVRVARRAGRRFGRRFGRGYRPGHPVGPAPPPLRAFRQVGRLARLGPGTGHRPPARGGARRLDPRRAAGGRRHGHHIRAAQLSSTALA